MWVTIAIRVFGGPEKIHASTDQSFKQAMELHQKFRTAKNMVTAG